MTVTGVVVGPKALAVQSFHMLQQLKSIVCAQQSALSVKLVFQPFAA